MSSITVGQIVNQAATRLGLATAHAPANFATATLAELGEALETLAGIGPDGGAGRTPAVLGAASWVRAFAVDLDEEPPAAVRTEASDGDWEVFAAADRPYAEELRNALRNARVGPGVLVCLPPRCPGDRLTPALDGARRALAGDVGQRFVLVQDGLGAAGLAKSLHLEAADLRTTLVVDTPAVDGVVDRIVAEVAATTRFTEACYDGAGTRRVPVLRVLPVRGERTDEVLDSSDVLLVTGGGKGITAECALAVADRTGAAVAVVGRSDPAHDEALAANLRRMADRGVRVGYARADVTGTGGRGGRRTDRRTRARHRGAARRRTQRTRRTRRSDRGGLPAHPRTEGRRTAGRSQGGRPERPEAAGLLRQRDRAHRTARRGALRHRQRTARRPRRAVRRRVAALPCALCGVVRVVRCGHGREAVRRRVPGPRGHHADLPGPGRGDAAAADRRS